MTSPTTRPAAMIDQAAALATAADHLQGEFAGAVVIDRFLHSSYDELATRATVVNYLPLPAERFARQRLCALAEIEGHPGTGQPAVLFLCTHNAGRCQMALGYFHHFAGDRGNGWSGGTIPGGRCEEWDLPDHTGAVPATIRDIRDAIEERVRALVTDLDLDLTN